MKRPAWIPFALMGIVWFCAVPMSAQTGAGIPMIETYCASCHGNPASTSNAPDMLSLWKLTSQEVYAALAKGPHASLQGITDREKREIANSLGNSILGAADIADAKLMPNQCAGNPSINDLSDKPMWNGWGNGVTNARFQNASAAGLSADQVPQLKLKWAFGFPGAYEVYGQPTIAAGRVFLGVNTGAVYSIDAGTGCVYWSFQADAGVRSAISIGPVKGQGSTKFGIYFGDMRSNVYMLDATTGKQVWKVKVEDNPVSHITAGPTLYEGRLYVPVASIEERTAGLSSVYPCCQFRGSVSALDANTGHGIWKTYTIPETPEPTTKSAKGIQHWGPSGGAVWNSPTIDAKNSAIYIGNGDAYAEPATKTTDAVMALDMKTGKILWAIQDTENDAWLSGCVQGSSRENCPKDLGPDYDFGSSPILHTLPNGHRILVAGQKSGMVWAHDPDRKEIVVWKQQLVPELVKSAITFGGAADDQSAYFGLRSGGVAAVQLDSGEKKWFTPIAPAATTGPSGENAAITAIPGVIFSGGWDGVMRAFATGDGRLLWEYNMIREFDTVNHVAAKGGSMGAPGPTVAGGMLFVGSGYVFGAGTPGNVLLAFSVQ